MDNTIGNIFDNNQFKELVMKNNRLQFKTKHNFKSDSTAIFTCYGYIDGNRVLVVFFNKTVRMGTVGVKEGEKIGLSFEFAQKKRIPVITFVLSGGIRIEEGTLALMQMLKTIICVKHHSDKGLLYIAIVQNPTLGGVSASFVSLADIIIAESNAIFGFTGKRIIEKSIQKELPHNFQTANYGKEHGMVDMIVPKENIKTVLAQILKLHNKGV